MVGGRALGFEVLGLDRGVLMMIDRETESRWTHFEGKAVSGPLAGTRLPLIPLEQMTWGEWMQSHPDTLVLDEHTGFEGRYREVRPGFQTGFTGAFTDDRLPPNSIVVGVEANGSYKAYPTDLILARGGVVDDAVGAMPIVVTFDKAARGGLAYSRVVEDRVLSFEPASAAPPLMRDAETGSLWDFRGVAVSGPLTGRSLEWVPSFVTQWYGWWIYHPDTEVLGAAEEWAGVEAPEVPRRRPR